MSISRASQPIPLGTLFTRYKGLYISSTASQTIFTHAEDKALLRVERYNGEKSKGVAVIQKEVKS